MKKINYNILKRLNFLILFILVMVFSVDGAEFEPETEYLSHKKRKIIDENHHTCHLSAVDVGRFFLQIHQETDSSVIMDKMKLHKLLYYAQGYYLSFYGTPLFQDEVHAYPNGDFIPKAQNLYQECEVDTQSIGSLVLKENASTKQSTLMSLVEFSSAHVSTAPENFNLTETIFSNYLEFCKIIFEMKKDKTGWQLRNECHAEHPWKTFYKNGEKNLIPKYILGNFFSEPSQLYNFFKVSSLKLLQENNIDGFINILKRTKKTIQSYKQAEDLISLNDYMSKDNINCSREQIDEICRRIPELIITSSIDINKAINGYLFFPHEFIEGYISNIILFSKIDIHYKLAISANYEYPLGHIYFTKLLKTSEIFEDKIQIYFAKNLTNVETLPLPLKGLCYLHMDMFDEAKESLQQTFKESHTFFQYLYARILEREDIDASFNIYKKIEESYPEASFQLAYHQESENEQFNYFNKAAQKGILEGYVKIGELIKQGYVYEGEEDQKTASYWFKKAADKGYINALLALGNAYEENNKWEEAFGIYQKISDQQCLIGHLKKGQILENKSLYEEAKKTYQEAMWLGFHKLFEMKISPEDENILNEIETNKNSHFEDLIKIVEGATENDENY